MSSGVGILLSSSTASTPACPLRRHSRKGRLAAPKRATFTTCQQKRERERERGGGDSPAGLLLDRRDVLLALGGAAASNVGLRKETAVAMPVVPDLTKCHTATAPGVDAQYLKCCPPFSALEVVDYDFPATPLRVRRPAHLVKSDEEYLSKYEEATRKMKELPVDDPRNFYQQSHVHCAYCNDAYYEKGNPNVNMQVHSSWFFFPFHRFYLHFYERILGSLIDDETFALPYWNFDAEAGMTIPEIFTDDTSSPLYNPKRNASHFYPAILDYKYSYNDETRPSDKEHDKELVLDNYSYMKKTFKQSLQASSIDRSIDPLLLIIKLTRNK